MEDDRPYHYRSPRPAVTVDTACFAEHDGRTFILLIERGHEPFRGSWALPGGFVDEGESLDRAAARELEEETGLRNVDLEQFRAYGDPGRDPRGHTITVVYIACCSERFDVEGLDDAARAGWFPVDALPQLAFDHDRIIREALRAYPGGERVRDHDETA